MVSVELKVFPPKDHSPAAPVLVKLVTPEYTEPFSRIRGEIAVRSPPKAEDGPTWRSVVAPVSVKLIGALPSCVNCRSSNVPAENPPEPTPIDFPAERVAVAVADPLQN